MTGSAVLKTGIVGSLVAAVCCFTPAPVLLLGAFGLSVWLGWIDYVLLPVFVLFLGLTGYGLRQRQRAIACCAGEERPANGGP